MLCAARLPFRQRRKSLEKWQFGVRRMAIIELENFNLGQSPELSQSGFRNTGAARVQALETFESVQLR